jgi:hypothetical protein
VESSCPGEQPLKAAARVDPGIHLFSQNFLKRWIAGSTLAIAWSDRSPGNDELVFPFERDAR